MFELKHYLYLFAQFRIVMTVVTAFMLAIRHKNKKKRIDKYTYLIKTISMDSLTSQSKKKKRKTRKRGERKKENNS